MLKPQWSPPLPKCVVWSGPGCTWKSWTGDVTETVAKCKTKQSFVCVADLKSRIVIENEKCAHHVTSGMLERR